MEPISVPISPSLLHNNLVSSEKYLAYVSNVKPNPQIMLVSINSLSTPYAATSQVKYQNFEDVLSIGYLNLGSQWYLVLGFLQNAQIWNEDGSRMPGYLSKDDIQGSDSETYFIGSCTSDPLNSIIIGSSKGSISLLSPNPESPSQFLLKSTHTSRSLDPIATICSHQQKILSFSESGQGIFWNFSTGLENSYIEGPKVSATVSTVIKKFAIVGFGSGEIRVVNMKDEVFVCTLWSHTRWITGICKHSTRPIFVTCSEDCTIAAWALRNGEVELVGNKEVSHTVLTGVCFVGEKVAAVGYDKPKIMFESIF